MPKDSSELMTILALTLPTQLSFLLSNYPGEDIQ